jgi:DNA polymerase III alpha subunit (gram-positive type)
MEKYMNEVYISVDVESDGPIPGPNSMLSFGAAAFDVEGKKLSQLTYNLALLDGAVPDKDTMEWWSKQGDAWTACRKNLQDPAFAMTKFVSWVDSLPGKPVFVAYPAGYDFVFMYWYMMKFVKRSPFSHSALDMKTLAMSLMNCEYRKATKKNMPQKWFGKSKHNHIALDDAIEQGELFCNMLKELNILHHGV